MRVKDLRKIALALTGVLPLLALLIGVNLYADPADLFGIGKENYEQQIANIILSGENAYGVANFDERLVRKYCIMEMQEPIDAVHLGASLFHQWRTTRDDMTFFNSWVSVASLYDYMGLVELYYENGKLPKTFFIGIHSQLFDRDYIETDRRYESIETECSEMLNILLGNTASKTEAPFVNRKYLELVSFSYFQESIERLEKEPVDSTQADYGELAIYRADGSYAVSAQLRERSTEDVSTQIEDYIGVGSLTHISPAYHMDVELVSEFEMLIRFLIANDIEVVFLLAPYFPDVYDYILGSPDYSEALEVETYALRLAEENNIPLFGSLNPYLLHCDNADFLDVYHLREKSIHKVLGYSALGNSQEIIGCVS